jgi:Tol biopolymer transport system component
MPSMIGRVVGQYRITAKLGEGGMGIVYRATDESLRRDVALKFIRDRAESDPDAHDRFMAEARAVAALNHPNICTVYQVLEADAESPAAGRVPVLAMELVAGETLAARLERDGRLPIDEAIRIAIEVADGLAEAHDRGVVHRDLKPHNVMIAAGRVKILDFGLATPVRVEAHSELTTHRAAWTGPREIPGQVMGTVAYMAPEQALGRPTDARADVFSFGVMLYELVTGVRPFQGTETAETIAKVIAGNFDPPAVVRPDTPAALGAVIARCLRKDPADRYASARELADALRRAQMAPLDAGSATTEQLAVSSRGRRPLWVFAAAGALVAIGVAFAAQAWMRRAPAGTGPVEYSQLTFVNDASFPAISKDGSLVAYVRGEPWGEVFQTAAPRASQKVVIHDTATSQVREVAECRPCLHLQWSSDGSSLFVLTERAVVRLSRLGGVLREYPSARRPFLTVAPGGSAFATAQFSSPAIVITDAQTGQTSSIPVTGDGASIRAIAWSPSGDRLAVLVGRDDRRHLWSVSLSGGPQTVLADDLGPVNTISWSAAGDAVYFLKTSGLSRDLWKLPINPASGEASGPAEVVLNGLQAGPNFSVSGDGRSLVYTRETRFANLWQASLGRSAGATPTQLTRGTHLDQYPAISPDGRSLAFVRADGRGSDLHVMPTDGGEARRLTFLDRVFGAPAWSPDGTRLAFCSGEKESRRVWTIPVEGGTPTPLPSTICTALESEVPVTWAPGRDILYQRDGNRNYHRVDPATGAETPLVANPERGWVFGPRPFGNQMAMYWNERSNRGLWLMPPAPGTERFLAPGVWPLGWSADGATVVGFDAGAGTVVSVTAADGRSRVLRNLNDRRVSLVPSVSADFRTLVFSEHSILADVWVARNFQK